jgi:hypothetical protein
VGRGVQNQQADTDRFVADFGQERREADGNCHEEREFERAEEWRRRMRMVEKEGKLWVQNTMDG